MDNNVSNQTQVARSLNQAVESLNRIGDALGKLAEVHRCAFEAWLRCTGAEVVVDLTPEEVERMSAEHMRAGAVRAFLHPESAPNGETETEG